MLHYSPEAALVFKRAGALSNPFYAQWNSSCVLPSKFLSHPCFQPFPIIITVLCTMLSGNNFRFISFCYYFFDNFLFSFCFPLSLPCVVYFQFELLWICQQISFPFVFLLVSHCRALSPPPCLLFYTFFLIFLDGVINKRYPSGGLISHLRFLSSM